MTEIEQREIIITTYNGDYQGNADCWSPKKTIAKQKTPLKENLQSRGSILLQKQPTSAIGNRTGSAKNRSKSKAKEDKKNTNKPSSRQKEEIADFNTTGGEPNKNLLLPKTSASKGKSLKTAQSNLEDTFLTSLIG